MAKRTITPEQFADALERHLLGTEGKWDWDDTTSIAITDERLERIRRGLTKFDRLARTKEQEELKAHSADSQFPFGRDCHWDPIGARPLLTVKAASWLREVRIGLCDIRCMPAFY